MVAFAARPLCAEPRLEHERPGAGAVSTSSRWGCGRPTAANSFFEARAGFGTSAWYSIIGSFSRGYSRYALGLCGDPSRLGIKVSSAAAQRSDNSHLSPRTEPSRMVRPGIIQTLCASAVPARHAHQLLRAQCTPPRFGKASCFGIHRMPVPC